MLKYSQRGDFHNFRRFVHADFKRGTEVFRKPRPVFWELFFFGSQSPLKELFANTTIQMNLELAESRGPFDNDVLAVETCLRTPSIDDFFSFGELLAYSYYFGLQDLHHENLVLTRSGLQVIDLEQAFSDLMLPNQTLMLPTDPTITWSSALNVISKYTLDILPQPEAKALIDGFQTMSEFFKRHVSDIRSLLEDQMNNFRTQPIRIFFRGTREYVEHLKGIKTVSDLFVAEINQVMRGDVPYFFGFLDNRDVFYYTSADWEVSKAEIPPNFIKYTEFCGANPLDLISPNQLHQKWVWGMLYLTRKMPSLSDADLTWSTARLNRTTEHIEFFSSDFRARSRR